MINKNSRIFVAGHNGMIGSAVVRKLRNLKYKKIYLRNRKQLDLTNQANVYNYLNYIKADAVILAAARVGGIEANNNFKAEFIFENLSIQNNVIHGSYKSGVKNLIFLGSSCIYPKYSKQPIKEKYLLSNYLEKTNDAYAIAKIAGIKMCENYNIQYNTRYKCLMPANLFGPNDNYDPLTSHFLPAIIRKTASLKKNSKNNKLIMWGNGTTKREVLYVDDVGYACVYFMNKKTKHSVINIGSGKDFTINYYVKEVLNILKIKSAVIYDRNKPTGTPRKLLDCSIAQKYGWKPKISLKQGLIKTLNSLKKN